LKQQEAGDLKNQRRIFLPRNFTVFTDKIFLNRAGR